MNVDTSRGKLLVQLALQEQRKKKHNLEYRERL